MNVKQQVRVSQNVGKYMPFSGIGKRFFPAAPLLLYQNGASGERKGIFAHFARVNGVSFAPFRFSFALFGFSFAPNENPNRANETPNGAFGVSFAPNENPKCAKRNFVCS
jgi:hypothetical protein